MNVRTLILTENSTRAGEGSTAAEAAASQTCVKYHEQSIAVVCHSPSNQIWVSHSRNRQDERACDLQFSNDGEWVLHERGPVTPEAARRIVLENIDVVSGTETVPLHAAVGRIAAEELLSAVALAGFDNAAVDGFGIHADDHNLPIPLTLSIVECVPVGPDVNVLSRSAALRILTGAKVPAGIGSVVFERRTTRRGNKITLNELPESGANIRRRGEDGRGGRTDWRRL